MGEFAIRTRKRAAETLRRLILQEVAAEADPILELIGFLFEDGSHGVTPLADFLITSEQWLTWNQLALERADDLTKMITRLLEREQMELPVERSAMNQWAASLVLETLDQMTML